MNENLTNVCFIRFVFNMTLKVGYKKQPSPIIDCIGRKDSYILLYRQSIW